ncbi:B-box zinc finger protein 22-like isoform X2 [Aristolochia californica]|uniref:B-box zinc finger protein 22-like isoform X2 n=1 Tax=Aristolochia californica TaxID=171875 RepID=UPI0035E02755
MKIQCNACEGAEANVLCCADEAALCWACDEKVHAANKLASKHQRVHLSNSSSQMPKCDICKSAGYFFCLEDRALLCRKCDYAIHTANSFVSAHQRFLLTGVKVALESSNPALSYSKEKLKSSERGAEAQRRTVSDTLSKKKFKSSERGVEAQWRTVSDILPKEKSDSAERNAEAQWRTMSNSSSSISTSMDNNKVLLSQGDGLGRLPVTKLSFTGGTMMSGVMPDWPIDEFLGLSGLSENLGFPEQESSKADNGKLGDAGLSPSHDYTTEGDFDVDDCLGQVPEIIWTVPEIPSPPTASGLHWLRSLRKEPMEHSVFVPDVCSPFQDQMGPQVSKRTR